MKTARSFRLAGWFAIFAASTAGAQSVRLTGGPLVYAARLGSPTEAEAQSGAWWGVELGASIRRVHFTARGLAGNLGGNPSHPDRDARLTQLTARLRLKPWLAVGLDAQAQRLESQAAITVWRTYGIGMTLSGSLGIDGLEARADIAAFPASSVAASQPMRLPTRVEMGLRYRAPRLPLQATLAYRLETLDFRSAADLRLGGLLVGVAVEVAR